MAKIQIKSEKLTPFGGIFSIMEQFDSKLSPSFSTAMPMGNGSHDHAKRYCSITPSVMVYCCKEPSCAWMQR